MFCVDDPLTVGLSIASGLGLVALVAWVAYLFRFFYTKTFGFVVENKHRVKLESSKTDTSHDCKNNWLVNLSPVMVLVLAIVLFIVLIQ